jgi:hypothetical protein
VDPCHAGFIHSCPGGVTHDFENRGEIRAGVLNLSIPGSFESHMPSIAQWFAENPPKMPASNQALQFTTGRRAERLNDEWSEW